MSNLVIVVHPVIGEGQCSRQDLGLIGERGWVRKYTDETEPRDIQEVQEESEDVTASIVPDSQDEEPKPARNKPGRKPKSQTAPHTAAE